MYREAADRRDAISGGADYAGMMRTLDLKVGFGPAREKDLDRVHELIDRTNQFSTTTIRRGRSELSQLLRDPAYGIYLGTLADKFGELGVVGVTVVRRDGDARVFDAVIMSCRAMGFGFETVLLRGPIDAETGFATAVGHYVPTERNRPCAAPFSEKGFSEAAPGGVAPGPRWRAARDPRLAGADPALSIPSQIRWQPRGVWARNRTRPPGGDHARPAARDSGVRKAAVEGERVPVSAARPRRLCSCRNPIPQFGLGTESVLTAAHTVENPIPPAMFSTGCASGETGVESRKVARRFSTDRDVRLRPNPHGEAPGSRRLRKLPFFCPAPSHSRGWLRTSDSGHQPRGGHVRRPGVQSFPEPIGGYGPEPISPRRPP